MHYKQSKRVLTEIKQAKRILVNCHRSPDADSVSSALAMGDFLKSMDKDYEIISPDEVSENFGYIGNVKSIKYEVFATFDFSKYDLWIMLDSSGWNQVGLVERPSINIVNIDHHPNSDKHDSVNLIDLSATSTSEILYNLFQDLGFKIRPEVAQRLMVGLASDSHFFTNSNTVARSHEVAAELIDLGANNYEIVKNITMNFEQNALYLWRDYLDNFQIDKKYKFVWSAIPFEVFSKHEVTQSITSMVGENIFRKFQGLDFSVVMCEKTKNKLSMSFRSRNIDFDVASIAREIGGNGHKVAAGAAVEGLSFDKAVEKVLRITRKHAKKYAESKN